MKKIYRFVTEEAYFASVTSQPEKLSFEWEWNEDENDPNKNIGTPTSFEWLHTGGVRNLYTAGDPGQLVGVISSLGIPGKEQLRLDFTIRVNIPEWVNDPNIPPETIKGNLNIDVTRNLVTLASNFEATGNFWLVGYGTVTQC